MIILVFRSPSALLKIFLMPANVNLGVGEEIRMTRPLFVCCAYKIVTDCPSICRSLLARFLLLLYWSVCRVVVAGGLGGLNLPAVGPNPPKERH
jgi:hypothetical protein